MYTHTHNKKKNNTAAVFISLLVALVLLVVGFYGLKPQHVSALTCGSGSPIAGWCVTLLNPGTTSWTVPSDWSSSNNYIEVYGPGGNGATSGTGGGAGGAWAQLQNYSTTPGTVITVVVGAGGSGVATHFNGTLLYAAAGGNGSAASGGSAATAGSSQGTFVEVGGKGGNGSGGNAGGGGGAGGACDLAGAAGGKATSGGAGAGGQGDGNCGGLGGAAGNNINGFTNGGQGGTGTSEDIGNTGSGGGGGGGASSTNGGAGGTYGGGGGGAGLNATGGMGGPGVIYIAYMPPLAAPTVTLAPSTQSVASGQSGGIANFTLTLGGGTPTSYTYTLDNSKTPTSFTPSANSFSISGLLLGSHTVVVTATNSGGSGTSNSVTVVVSANASPSVTTNTPPSGITASAATLGATITATNGSNATQIGFAYSTSSTLNTNVSTTTLGAFVGTGSFSGGISTLTSNTTYYYRAYATNAGGTGYGTVKNFTTLVNAPTATLSPSSQTTVYGQSAAFTYTLGGDAPTSLSYKVDGGSATTIPNTGTFSTSTLSIGTHTIQMSVTNSGGTNTSNTVSLLVDGYSIGAPSSAAMIIVDAGSATLPSSVLFTPPIVRVRQGSAATLSWSVTGMAASISCYITPALAGMPASGLINSLWDGTSNPWVGQGQTAAVFNPGIYTLSCGNGTSTSTPATANVTLVPVFFEI